MKTIITILTLSLLIIGCGRSDVGIAYQQDYTIDATTNCEMSQDVYRVVEDFDNVGYYPTRECEINYHANNGCKYTLLVTDNRNEVVYTENGSLNNFSFTYNPKDFGAVKLISRNCFGHRVNTHTLFIVPLDQDKDGIWDHEDNCPRTYNPDQADGDKDGLGDVCDDDWDNDGVKNDDDNCPWTFNPDQADGDRDGLGDVCDDDWDNDDIKNDDDNCPWTFNPDQADGDKDGLGDVCDDDWDNDDIKNDDDNCPLTYNPDQLDTDGDGIGDVCDDDWDNDGIPNDDDNCPLTYNPDQIDLDNNGVGDACEPCDVCDGQVSHLALRYNGCVTAFVTIVEHDGKVVFSDFVNPGEVFTFSGQSFQGTFGPRVDIYYNCKHVEIHTSCSQPINPGLTFDNFEVVYAVSRNNGNICPL